MTERVIYAQKYRVFNLVWAITMIAFNIALFIAGPEGISGFISWIFTLMGWIPLGTCLIVDKRNTKRDAKAYAHMVWMEALEAWDKYDRMGCYSGLCSHDDRFGKDCVAADEHTASNRLD